MRTDSARGFKDDLLSAAQLARRSRESDLG
jgi:hypothetical protein